MSRFQHRTFLNLIQPGKWLFWIIISLIFKSSLFVYKLYEPTSNPNLVYTETFAREGGDCRSYFDPVENFIQTGTYNSYLTHNFIGSIISYGDYRMPGYGAVYYILRQFFDITETLNAIVILQLVLGSVSVYFLALTALNLFKSKLSFYLVFLLYVTSLVVSVYDGLLATESFCISTMIFSLYFLLKPGASKSDLFISGTFLTWCVFLRPVMAPLLILFAIFILIRKNWPRLTFRRLQLKPALFFLLSFIIVDGYWVYRNYKVHHGFHPLTTSLLYPGIENSTLGSVYAFMQSYGGSIMSWKSDTEINYFFPQNKMTDNKFPDYIFNEKFNFDSLKSVRNLIIGIQDSSTSMETKSENAILVREKLGRYTRSIIEEMPFHHHVTSRLIYLKETMVHSGSGILFEKFASELPVPLLLIKMYASILYWLILLSGLAGVILLLIDGLKQPAYLMLGLMIIYMSGVYPLILKLDEIRYFLPTYPLLILSGTFLMVKFYMNKRSIGVKS